MTDRNVVLRGSAADPRTAEANLLGKTMTRATDDDRNSVIGRLDDAFAVGALTQAEHEARASIALETTTRRDLAVLTEDLPVRLRKPAVATEKAVRGFMGIHYGVRGAGAIFALIAQFIIIMVVSGAGNNHPSALAVTFAILSGVFGAVSIIGFIIWMMEKSTG